MKKIRLHVPVLTMLALLGSAWAYAGHHEGAPYTGSKEFERLKALAGTWEGTGGMGTEQEKVRVEYRLTAGGSAIVETLFPGTPHEMVSVYYDRKGELAMTHYCMLRNQPHMRLERATANSLEFVLGEGSGFDPAKEPHMHALTITFGDSDHITQKWTLFEEGKAKGVSTFSLSRVH